MCLHGNLQLLHGLLGTFPVFALEELSAQVVVGKNVRYLRILHYVEVHAALFSFAAASLLWVSFTNACSAAIMWKFMPLCFLSLLHRYCGFHSRTHVMPLLITIIIMIAEHIADISKDMMVRHIYIYIAMNKDIMN